MLFKHTILTPQTLKLTLKSFENVLTQVSLLRMRTTQLRRAKNSDPHG